MTGRAQANERAWPPRAQRIYVHVETGEIGAFDSWATWQWLGTYRLSSGQFIKLKPREMRLASEAEIKAFARAKCAGVEVMANV